MQVKDSSGQEWEWLEENRPEIEKIALLGGYYGGRCPYAKPMCSLCSWKCTCSCIDKPGIFRTSLNDGGIF